MYEVLEPWHTVFGVICMKHSVDHVSKVTVRNPSFMKVFHLILVLGIPSGYFPVWVRRRHEGVRVWLEFGDTDWKTEQETTRFNFSISCGPIHMDKQTMGPTTTYNIRNPMNPVADILLTQQVPNQLQNIHALQLKRPTPRAPHITWCPLQTGPTVLFQLFP